jgi:hypothetical protein
MARLARRREGDALAGGVGGSLLMYLFYADESGDIGLTSSPTRHFVLVLSWSRAPVATDP